MCTWAGADPFDHSCAAVLSRSPVRFVATPWWEKNQSFIAFWFAWQHESATMLSAKFCQTIHMFYNSDCCWSYSISNNPDILRHARYQARQRHSWHERFHGWGSRVLRCWDFWWVEFPSMIGIFSVPWVYHSKTNEGFTSYIPLVDDWEISNLSEYQRFWDCE